MSAAAFGAQLRELLFVVAQRWWSMCSCGGRVLYNVNESKTRGREGERRTFSLWRYDFLSVPPKKKRHISEFLCKICRHRAKPGPQRRRVEGKPEVIMRERKATPERRMSETSHGLFIIPQSSSSITLTHSPAPPLALFHHFAVRPPFLTPRTPL